MSQHSVAEERMKAMRRRLKKEKMAIKEKAMMMKRFI